MSVGTVSKLKPMTCMAETMTQPMFRTLHTSATDADGASKEFTADVRIDTPKEWDYFKNGDILY